MLAESEGRVSGPHMAQHPHDTRMIPMAHATHGWIQLHNVRVAHASIGVYPDERTRPQAVIVDLDMWADIATPARTGQLVNTIDYAAVAAHVRAIVLQSHFDLLETLCDTIANVLLATYPIDQITVRVHKPEAVPDAQIAVAITRARLS